MTRKAPEKRKSYTPEFKKDAITLAKEIGVTEAADKLGIPNFQTLGAWVRYDKKITENAEFKELEAAKTEIKKLRKELEHEKKCTAILRDAAAFFCQDILK